MCSATFIGRSDGTVMCSATFIGRSDGTVRWRLAAVRCSVAAVLIQFVSAQLE